MRLFSPATTKKILHKKVGNTFFLFRRSKLSLIYFFHFKKKYFISFAYMQKKKE